MSSVAQPVAIYDIGGVGTEGTMTVGWNAYWAAQRADIKSRKAVQLTAAQIRWAADHDWFVRDNGDQTITVVDRSYDAANDQLHEDVLVWDDTFAALREWAGY